MTIALFILAFFMPPSEASAQGFEPTQTLISETGHPVRLPGVESATPLRRGSSHARVGLVINPNGAGLGTQTIGGGGLWRPKSSDLTFGFDIQAFDDPPRQPINGSVDNFSFAGVELHTGWSLIETEKLSVGILGTLAGYRVDQNPTIDAEITTFKRIALPATLAVNEAFSVSSAIGLSFAEKTLGGVDGFGRRAFLSIGAAYQVSDRLSFYGSAKQLFRDGRQLDDIGGDLLGTVGTRYALTPQLAVDAFVTNAHGTSPVASDLAFFGNTDAVAVGLMVNYSPSNAGTDAPRYRHDARPAQKVLAFSDGLTVKGPETIGVDQLRLVAASQFDQEQASVGLVLSPDPQWQFEAYLEQYALSDGNVFRSRDLEDTRYNIGGRWQALSEGDGDLVSLSFHGLFGRDIEKGSVGAAVVGVTAGRQFGSSAYIRGDVSAARSNNFDTYGLGLGATIRLSDVVDAIAEYTVVDKGSDVYSAGIRLRPRSFENMAIDAYVTNASGRTGIGSLVAQDEPKLAVAITYDFDFGLF